MIQASDTLQLIIGLGKTGLSCAEYFNDRKMPFRALDSRDLAPYAEQIAQYKYCESVFCGDLDLNLEQLDDWLENITEVIVSPGLSKQGAFFDRVRERGVDIIGDVELFAREVTAPVIAITGSNGKSTVTELTGELLKSAGHEVLVGGNIGIPVLSLLKLKTPDYFVLELSSFQLETTNSLTLAAGTVLNISADHMDRYDSFDEYAAVKLSMLENCQHIIVNLDAMEMEQLPSTVKSASRLSVTTAINGCGADYYRTQRQDGSVWLATKTAGEESFLIEQGQLKIAGLHNINNALAALALCKAAGVEASSSMLDRLSQWPGLKHRCEYIGEKRGVRCYNDSKATNVGATVAALEGLSETIKGDLILIAGGDGKGADFSPLATVFKRYLSALVLIGRDAERLLEEAGKGLRTVIAKDMKQAVTAAFSFAKSGDVILLSPACASLDMYDNFEQRGECFIRHVEALA